MMVTQTNWLVRNKKGEYWHNFINDCSQAITDNQITVCKSIRQILRSKKYDTTSKKNAVETLVSHYNYITTHPEFDSKIDQMNINSNEPKNEEVKAEPKQWNGYQNKNEKNLAQFIKYSYYEYVGGMENAYQDGDEDAKSYTIQNAKDDVEFAINDAYQRGTVHDHVGHFYEAKHWKFIGKDRIKEILNHVIDKLVEKEGWMLG